MWSKNYEIERTFIARLSHNADLLEEINNFCNDNKIRTGWVSIIGAIKRISLGFYDQQMHEYICLKEENLETEGPFEIIHCTGNISIKDGKPFAHLHIVASNRDGKCFGGHVMPGNIIFAGEALIQSFNGDELIRIIDTDTKLPLWQQ